MCSCSELIWRLVLGRGRPRVKNARQGYGNKRRHLKHTQATLSSKASTWRSKDDSVRRREGGTAKGREKQNRDGTRVREKGEESEGEEGLREGLEMTTEERRGKQEQRERRGK